MPLAQARHVLRVLLAAGRHDDQPASTSKHAEDLLHLAARVDAQSRSGGDLLSCMRLRMRICAGVQWDAPQWTGQSWVGLLQHDTLTPAHAPGAHIRAKLSAATRPTRQRLRIQLSKPAMQTDAGAWLATYACAYRWMKCMKFTEPSCCSTAPLGRPVLPDVKMM